MCIYFFYCREQIRTGRIYSLSIKYFSLTFIVVCFLLLCQKGIHQRIMTTVHDARSETVLATIPNPLKNFDIPLRPLLPIIIKSTISSVAMSTILLAGLPTTINTLICVNAASISRSLFFSPIFPSFLLQFADIIR